jgi:hypothetical protein
MRKIQTLLVKQSEQDGEGIYSHIPNKKIVRLNFNVTKLKYFSNSKIGNASHNNTVSNCIHFDEEQEKKN